MHTAILRRFCFHLRTLKTVEISKKTSIKGHSCYYSASNPVMHQTLIQTRSEKSRRLHSKCFVKLQIFDFALQMVGARNCHKIVTKHGQTISETCMQIPPSPNFSQADGVSGWGGVFCFFFFFGKVPDCVPDPLREFPYRSS